MVRSRSTPGWRVGVGFENYTAMFSDYVRLSVGLEDVEAGAAEVPALLDRLQPDVLVSVYPAQQATLDAVRQDRGGLEHML